MKLKVLFWLTAISLFSVQAQAQKFGFIETERIVTKMPEYKEVQGELEKFAENWKKRLESMNNELMQMKTKFLENL